MRKKKRLKKSKYEVETINKNWKGSTYSEHLEI